MASKHSLSQNVHFLYLGFSAALLILIIVSLSLGTLKLLPVIFTVCGLYFAVMSAEHGSRTKEKKHLLWMLYFMLPTLFSLILGHLSAVSLW